jgi:hypothetical protein
MHDSVTADEEWTMPLRTWSIAVVLAAFVTSACGGSGSGGASGRSPTPSAALSTVVVSSARAPADGRAASTVTVNVMNASGQALSGLAVTLTYSGTGTVAPLSATTDAAGTAIFHVTAAAATSGTVTAAVGSGAGSVVISTAPAIDFYGWDSLVWDQDDWS